MIAPPARFTDLTSGASLNRDINSQSSPLSQVSFSSAVAPGALTAQDSAKINGQGLLSSEEFFQLDDTRKEALEELAEFSIDNIIGDLATSEGRDALAAAIDGKQASERTLSEQAKMEEVLSSLTDSDALDMDVEVAKGGTVSLITTDSGQMLAVKLQDGEKSKTIKDRDGNNVLVLSDDIEDVEVSTEISTRMTVEVARVFSYYGVTFSEAMIYDYLSRFNLESATQYVLAFSIPEAINNEINKSFADDYEVDLQTNAYHPRLKI